MKSLIGFVVVVVLGLIAFNLFTFSVDETQVAVVIELGRVEQVVTTAGLHFKTPFIQNVRTFDERLQSYDIQPREIITQDQRRLVVDNYAIWRVVDPKRFVETVNGNFSLAQSRLDDIVFSNLRNTLADQTLENIVSERRQEFLERITADSAQQLQQFGIGVLDVRIMRADLPEANEQAVYGRMQSERQQIAAQLRAEGEQQATEIRARAEREAAVIRAEARRTAQETRGQGDAESLRIYADAYSQDAQFYRFWRTLESYEQTFAERGDSTLVLGTDSEYLRLFSVSELESLLNEN